MDTVPVLKFSRSRRDFSVTLNRRVNEYFKMHGLSRYANPRMLFKTTFMLALYALPYLLIVTGWVSGVFLTLSMVVLMSLGLSGIGLCVMHDANHGAYSRRAWVNSMMGYSLNAVGASCFNWKVQHNVMHHTYTNVYGSDEDIGSRGVLRLSPRAKWRKFHKYQFIYAWFLYGFMTLLWMFFKILSS